MNDPGSDVGVSDKLPTFEQFSKEMQRWLTLVPRRKLRPLLKCLYLAAQDKIAFDQQRTWAGEKVVYFREGQIAMGAAKKSLGQLLEHLKSENEKHRESFETIENSTQGEEFEFTFEEIIQHLKDGIEAAGNFQLANAGQIHPHLRNKTEKALAKETLPRNHIAGTIVPHTITARDRSPDIDHWFIGAAAECLDRCLVDRHDASKSNRLPRYDTIISELFKVCFPDQSRSEENVRQELGRQKKAGHPVCDRPSAHLMVEERSDRRKGQKSSRSRSRHRKLSEQK